MSEHFSIDELTHSQAAIRLGLDNTPSPSVIANLNRLCETLEAIRALAGVLHVDSGYRSPLVNKAVGGAANSAHVLGLAADIVSKSMTSKALALLIRESGIKYDQLINEGNWVHVGLSVGQMRNQTLTANFCGGKATYTAGL